MQNGPLSVPARVALATPQAARRPAWAVSLSGRAAAPVTSVSPEPRRALPAIDRPAFDSSHRIHHSIAAVSDPGRSGGRILAHAHVDDGLIQPRGRGRRLRRQKQVSMRVLYRAVVVVALFGLALPAWAADGPSSSSRAVQRPQPRPQPRPQARPRPKRPPIGIRAYAAVDFDQLAAKQSYKAVVGSSHIIAYGAGVDVLDVWKHVFIRGAVTHASRNGTRVFVDTGQVFSLGQPITISWTPIELGGGWRFKPTRSRLHPITPYVGGAFVALDYKETSPGAEAGDDVTSYLPGAEGFGGVEFGILKHLAVSAEAQYRTVPNALGTGGVSKDFNETNAGGFTARVMIAFKR